MKIILSRLHQLSILIILIPFISSCKPETALSENFNRTNDRVWIGEEFWSVPIEDWEVKNGKVYSTGIKTNMRLNVLTHTMAREGDSKISFDLGISTTNKKPGIAGIEVGIKDISDSTIKSLVYFGKGTLIGVDPEGYFFIDDEKKPIPEGFDLSNMSLTIRTNSDTTTHIIATLSDSHNMQLTISYEHKSDLSGSLALFNRIEKGLDGRSTNWWFDNLILKGSALVRENDDSFGPILWAMYTLSSNTLKLTAQMPPLGINDEKQVHLELRDGSMWNRIASAEIETAAWLATFKVDSWDNSLDHHYRLVYDMKDNRGKTESFYYEGLVREEPAGGELVMGALTCQYAYGFPYAPLVNNLERHDPDILYFSGDQLYEANGGYGIERFPADRAILNYLGKWYMFGWAFGDLLRDRPSICIPDDHEVFQGNLWGDNGKKVSIENWGMSADCLSGFVEPAEMVNVVMRTNCSHLPDPYDPTPMQQDIPVYYTDLVYGGVSFAIVGDRVFKSGPELVSTWEGRKDHISDPGINTSDLENPELKLLGDRQISFLEDWILDWEDAYMKVLLSQTLLTNAATHHGANKMFLIGDMDSGGWPKTGRDRALRLLRKASIFHICGDQHLPSLIQYGIDDFRDAGWAYCTPAITVGYQRRFLPDSLGWKVEMRPGHNLPNTGYYTDAFSNKNYIYAIGNPEFETADMNRYLRAQKSSSGFGIVRFDSKNRKISSEAYRFLADFGKTEDKDIFPGWPLTIDVSSNTRSNAKIFLPVISTPGLKDGAIIIEDSSGQVEFSSRISGSEISIGVFGQGPFTAIVGDPEMEIWLRADSLYPKLAGDTTRIMISFSNNN